MKRRDNRGRYMAWVEGLPVAPLPGSKKQVRKLKVETVEQADHRRRVTRERKQRERDEMRIGHRVPGLQGHGARSRKEAAIQETVVRRRCEGCGQVFEAKVKEGSCSHCGFEVEAQ